ncbi:MAG: TIGR01244 family phosphatase [Alteromonadaceae bacterium TMED7]|nr:TIGR01244 family phosphatase [Alteromonadaceae bacterium]RPH21317.1 MAG: TIGR01244 family phosphatase [Alteromonadaceae bacterium TMED7]|tara:strand:+ start:8437 stop:8880 length:444 start_codon:yes stop_codon:yes gene_type:complete
MNIRTINHHFSVSGPLTKADIYALAEAGVTTLINGRPDFEEPNQIPDAMLRNWARGASLEYYFVPVVSGNYSERDVAEFGRILLGAEGRVHAICRTGTRVLHLWALARWAQGLSQYEIKQAGDQAGVDLDGVLLTYQNSISQSQKLH